MADQNIDNMTALWNTGGTEYSAIKMNVTNAASAVGSKLIDLRIADSPMFTTDKAGNVTAAGTITAAAVVASGSAQPAADDGAALGSPTKAWSDLFLASGGVINWEESDVTITHAANQLLFGGASNGYSFDFNVNPLTNDLASLGTAVVSWSDLYLATGGVINWGNGDVTLTHSADALTVGGGDLRVTSVGSNIASVVTAGATQTLTSKTLTSPTINSAIIASPAITGTPTAAGATWSNLGAVSNCDINGGTIDGASIGQNTPNAIKATVLQSEMGVFTGAVSADEMHAPTGTFNTHVYGGRVKTAQIVESLSTNLTLAPIAGLNSISLRPRGAASATGEVTIDSAGSVTMPGNLYAGGGTLNCGTVNATANVNGVDFHAERDGPTGVIYLGNTGTRYLYFDGTSYRMPTSPLIVSSDITTSGILKTNSYVLSTDTTMIVGTTGVGSIYLRSNGYTNSANQIQIDSSGNMLFDGAVAAASGGIYMGRGHRGKMGYQGNYDDNWTNMYYSSPNTQLWVDASNRGNITTTSDYRAKRNVEPLTSMWEKVRALKPVKYLWQDWSEPWGEDGKMLSQSVASDEEQWGFLAHELQETLTKSAATGEKDAVNVVQSPNQWAVITALTAVIQEMQARIEALEAGGA